MHAALEALAQTLALKAESEYFFTLSEGLIKVRAIESALDLGWTLQEGAPAPGSAFTIRTGAEGIKISRELRRLTVLDGSADMYVIEPFEMMLEIKARPDVGSKAHAQFDQIMPDITRVAAIPKMALLFVFDQDIYSSFSGERSSVEGRPSTHKNWFNSIFPIYSDILEYGKLSRHTKLDGNAIEFLFISIKNPIGANRILVVGARSDAEF